MMTPLKFSRAIALALMVFFGLAGMPNVHGQSAQKARYDKVNKVLSLDETAMFGYIFQLDIAPMNFSSKENADEFFSNWTSELVSFQVNFEKRSADIILKTRSKPGWRAKEWNTYLAQLPKQ